MQVLTVISDGLGVQLEHARLYEEARERAREIQRLNEYTNRILASNPSALAVLTGSGREVVSVNRAFCQTLGLDEKLVEGRPISEVLPWDGLEEVIRQSLASPADARKEEMRYLAEDGSERWVLVSAVPLLTVDEADPEEESLLVLNDITEQKWQQERMQEHSRLAAVGELAAGVAHEINNPLAAILGLSELIQMENLPSQVTEDARKIQEAAQRAAKIVQNLLSFARKHEPEKRYMDVASIVDRAIELKSHDFKLNNIGVTVRHAKAVPATMVDELQLTQVVLNILTNAEQAIREGQGAGEVTATTQLLNGKIRISIADDGPGIPAESLHSIFDPFFTTKEAGEGTGLGLSICYGIIREHGGELWAESNRGEGAIFHIELPVSAGETSGESRTTETPDNFIPSLRVLVVDDEPVVRDTLSRVLSGDGHDVALASNGNNAWDLIQTDDFDIIFVDLRMPGLDGQGLYQLANGFSPDLARKMVFITGDTTSASARNFIKSTGNPFLSKPFSIRSVRQILQASA